MRVKAVLLPYVLNVPSAAREPYLSPWTLRKCSTFLCAICL